MIRRTLINLLLVPACCLGAALAQDEAVLKKPAAHPTRVAVSMRHTGAASLRTPAPATKVAAEASSKRRNERTASLPRVHFRH